MSSSECCKLSNTSSLLLVETNWKVTLSVSSEEIEEVASLVDYSTGNSGIGRRRCSIQISVLKKIIVYNLIINDKSNGPSKIQVIDVIFLAPPKNVYTFNMIMHVFSYTASLLIIQNIIRTFSISFYKHNGKS